VGRRVSSALGPLKLRDIKGGRKARVALIRETLDGMRSELGPHNNRLFLVGGSWRAIAKIDMHRRGYPLHVLHEYRMTAKAVRDTAKFIAKSNLEDLRAAVGVSNARMILVPHAIEVLREVVKAFKPHDIAVSSYGIREGLLYEQMPQRLRDRDPLIESCRFAEAKDARVPGFGKLVFNYIQPIFKSIKPERRRLVKAACLLHDVSWRAHPDYRAEVCFDNATRANLGGLKHSERVFLGLALLHRYSNRRDGTPFEELYDLLPPADQNLAEVLGKAMRFAAVMWLSEETDPGELRWFPKKKLLELRLSPHGVSMFGEVAEARFQSLASSLGSETQIKRLKA